MAETKSRAERMSHGRALRKRVPRSAHAECRFDKHRDPVAILAQTDAGRMPELLPLRYGRMLHSPFAFLRGAASIMAFDLARTPVTGFRVQACGDCHLLNFGAFATPERNVIFDINDFDETLPGPWEWDIKRLATSVMVAGRYRGFPNRYCVAAVLCAVKTYRAKLAEYAEQPVLSVWYARIDARELLDLWPAPKHVAKAAAAAAPYAAARLLPRLTEVDGGKLRIKDDPPLVYHAATAGSYSARIKEALSRYRDSLPPERRVLLDRYTLADIAMKVVGVGSVGTRCAIALFLSDAEDPLFLQFKEARSSVLEPYVGKSSYGNHGERVVIGQRLMQSASDLFLGWSHAGNPRFDFYVRQLRDTKISVALDQLTVAGFTEYVYHCGWATARAHAKTGDAAAISGYLGKSDAFDKAIVRFARAYADQTERDHAGLVKAAESGRVQAALSAAAKRGK
jgi:uncharacterized protein (DUF2252 family)